MPEDKLRQLAIQLHDLANEVQIALGRVQLTLLKPVTDPSHLQNLTAANNALISIQNSIRKSMRLVPAIRAVILPPVSLSVLIEEFGRACAEDHAVDGILVKTYLWPDTDGALRCVVDKVAFRRAMLNLTMNACQAMKGGGTLTLSTVLEDDKACIRVTDTGEGFTDEALQHLWEWGYTTKPTGNGFGMPSVKKFVEDHGGTIRVETRRSVGTMIEMCFPAVKVAPEDDDE